MAKVRTMVKNRVHRLFDTNRVAVPAFSDLFGKGGLEWLKSAGVPALDRLTLDNHLEHLESLRRQVEAVDREITVRASEDKYVKLLLDMTGIDVFTALWTRSEIGDVSRFTSYKKLISSSADCVCSMENPFLKPRIIVSLILKPQESISLFCRERCRCNPYLVDSSNVPVSSILYKIIQIANTNKSSI